MRIFIIASAVSLFAVTGAAAQERVSDQQYLQLSRCAGLAAGLGQDAGALNTALRDARVGRSAMMSQMAQSQQNQARSQSSRARGSRLNEFQQEFEQQCAVEAR